jgi:branched-chain amino acid aminotransferase
MVTHQALFTPHNRSFRYGDGVFETIKVLRSEILLVDYHFDRLFTSLSLLKIEAPDYLNRDKVKQNILELC